VIDTSALVIRRAKESDCGTVLDFIRKIAEYEHLSDQVVATESGLYQAIFVQHDCQVILAFEGEIPVGFALFFYNFSTFKGKKGLYLEDLYVEKGYRHQGIGKQLIGYLIQVAKTEHCGRMEWTCLDWNQSAIDFYSSLGAKPMSDWTIFRLDEETLKRL
jgi:GNAT superfamily N-acetyltransferase